MADVTEDVIEEAGAEPMPNADAEPKAVPLFRVDMALMPDGQIVGMSLVWNGAAVRSAEFAATVLNEVKRQLEDVAVTSGLLLSAVTAAAKFDEEVGDVAE